MQSPIERCLTLPFPPECRFQKAIKKVRATQRLRRSRGFAFSQTESAKDGGRDQERLIRAYDTTLQVRRSPALPHPSGGFANSTFFP